MRLFRSRPQDRERVEAAGPETGSAATALRVPQRLADPSLPPTARGSWAEAALMNVDVTEYVKRQVGAQTPPWKK